MGDTTSTAVAEVVKAPPRRRDIKELLEGPEIRAAVQAAMGDKMSAERFVRVAINATMRQPALLECSKVSFYQVLLDLASYGLEADGRRAHLIPFWNTKMCICNHQKDSHQAGKCMVAGCTCMQLSSRRDVQLIIDYKGLAELVRKSGDVSYIHADAVYKGDDWSFGYGSDAHLRHKPNLEVERIAEKRIAYYSFVKLRDGSEDFIVFSPSQVDAIRKRSKTPNNGPWVSDYDEMGKKTVFRNHSKWLPLKPEVKDAIEHDDDAIDIDVSDAMNAGRALSEGSTEAAEALLQEKLAAMRSTQSEDTNGQAPDAAESKNGAAKADPEPKDNPAEKKAAIEIKRYGPKNGFAVYSALPAMNTVPHGQRVYVRGEDGTDKFYRFDGEIKRADGGEGEWLPEDEPQPPTSGPQRVVDPPAGPRPLRGTR